MKTPARIQAIQPFHVMALLARARELEAQGRDIVHMEIGEPDFPTPQPIIDAATQAISKGDVHYTPAVGLRSLRQAIASFYQQRYAVTVDAGRIIVTPGASGALMLALGAIMGEGETVLMSDPGYPCNRNFVQFLAGQAVNIPVTAASNYQLTVELLQQHWQTNTVAAMVASPANPTGTLLTKAQLQTMADFVKQQQGYFIVDEIYHGLVYDSDCATALNMNDNVIVINSFSKYFGMTGWRLGWLVVPDKLVADVDKLAQNIFLSAPTPSQYAALAAFVPQTIDILEQRKQEFQRRRDYLLPALQQLGFSIATQPQGAFYIYAGCEKFSQDSFQFCHALLEQAGVAITPGIDFGQYQANTSVRFAYTTSIAQLEEGISRLRNYLQ